mmetsp:Transcript_8143/g.22595  ORF Transcript_8143/g.22595 Transcript_8143/m.22595 type:complete len:330 (-) Transcript_8143:505-1494(-)|eukprot:CAMPEP_0168724934 /NCGR_PEP_ID=MMETSP0724-20121128/3890_1 /TAXON_ID=265536 /ORGANISM="Amphiprora sp., Strain CCMP467" /LENGTH=329 /DNA_ID=CAMNT_0008771695 /DNA_START=11 /DNA_END=1000 /DNA_ORIENTATION=+
MTKKLARDPNAPKRNLSAYLLYQNAMREQFKALNPGMTFGQLAKYTSAMYSELPPSEKEAWVARAEADKARYLSELAVYMPSPGFDPKGDAIVNPVTTKSGGKGKQERDINAPKRHLSAYLLYQNAMREQFKRENPGMTFGQLAKYTSHMYKNLTPEEKGSWEERARLDKSRYDQEIAAYVPPPGHDSRGVLIDDQRPRRRNKRGPKDPSAPKRASGAYVFFTNEMRPKVLAEFPGIKFVDLGKVMGERWRALVPEEKKKFENLAAEDKVRFQLEMQQYTANQAASAASTSEGSFFHDPSSVSAAIPYDAYGSHDQAQLDPYGQQHFPA